MFRPGFVHLDAISDFHFTTPVVINQDPEPNASNVEVSTVILFELYYETGGASPDLSTLNVTVNGVQAVLNGSIQPAFNGPNAAITTYTPNRILYALDPISLVGLSTYDVEVTYSGTDSAFCHALWSFSTEDTHGPVLISATPLGRKTLQVTFAQTVVSEPQSVLCNFPWGQEPLVFSNGKWIFSPISYPWVKANNTGGYNLRAGMLLHVIIDDKYEIISVPWDTTDAVTTASALDTVLSLIGAGCRARNGYVWLYSANPRGSIEVLPGGANDLLVCERGRKTARLAFETVQGPHSLEIVSLQPSGIISKNRIQRILSNDNTDFVLYQLGEEFSNTVLDPSNYMLEVDEQDCKMRIAPAYTPKITSVEIGSSNKITLTLSQVMTPGARYTLRVSNIRDAYGNVIDPNPSTIDFIGYRPATLDSRNLKLYDLFPEHLRQQDANREFQFKKVCAIFQEVIDQIFVDLDEYLVARNPATAPFIVVERMLEMYGNQFNFLPLSPNRKRALLELLVDFYRLRGTEAGIDAALRFFFGFNNIKFLYYWGHGWELGTDSNSYLGESTILNTADIAKRFSFSVVVDRALSDIERVQVRQVIERMKTGHTHLVDIREPAAPFIPNHWQIPWSELGTNTWLH